MIISPAILAYHNANRYYEIFRKEIFKETRQTVQSVIQLAEQIRIITASQLDKDMLAILAEHHLDGVVDQYNLLNKFWDNEAPHNVLGYERLQDFFELHPEFDTNNESVAYMADVMLHYKNSNVNSSMEQLSYRELITIAVDFDYAFRNFFKLSELKNSFYTQISEDVWYNFKNGIVIGFNNHFESTADLILSTATLAMNCIYKYGHIAKFLFESSGYGYPTILDGYRYILSCFLSPYVADTAFEVIRKQLSTY